MNYKLLDIHNGMMLKIKCDVNHNLIQHATWVIRDHRLFPNDFLFFLFVIIFKLKTLL